RIGERMRQFQLPVFAILGENDFMVSPKSLDILLDRIPHLKSELIPNSTHFPQAERPLIVNPLIQSFILESENLS
ncbi:MAG: alpha/beta hydrolase, partial [Candidatus ainarchaeum sp.]|nr:alpha/beta hydrolase [Candidatus ainarchaeum sp.]